MSIRSKVFRLGFFIAILLAATVAAVSGQRENEVLVVSIVGDWRYQDSLIKFGQTLIPARQACLTGSDGSIVVRSFDNNGSLHAFACEKPFRDRDCSGQEGRCAVPLHPENWKSSGSASENFWAAVRRLVAGEPEKYMVAASRGLEPSLVDAVVPQQAGNVNLAAAFREMAAGQYWVKIAPVDSSGAASGTQQLHFVPKTPVILPASGLRPGLYHLILVDETSVPAGSDCWILISWPENYPTVSDAFQRAQQMSAKWPDDMDPSAVRALLRAYLESLAKSQSKP